MAGEATQNRAFAENTRNIVFYAESHHAYFLRGIAKFYAVDRREALADLSQASELTPNTPITRFGSKRGSGRAASRNRSRILALRNGPRR